MSRYSQIFRNTFRLIILTVFFFGVISNTLVVAKSPEEAGTKNNLSMPKQKLSTPELIEQAFANGEITAEQRIRYLAYALYDYESLPIQFHGSVGWSGTPYVWEIDKTLNAVNSGDISHFSSALQHELNLLSVQSTAVCDREDGPNSTESANFHLNYDTVGGELTIENYKTSLETSFATEVTSYGWAKPL